MARKVIENLHTILHQAGLDNRDESFIESMISTPGNQGQACDPEFKLGQADMALNLEICDMINKKKSTMYTFLLRSRDAAFAIVRYVNRGNANSASLALTVLFCLFSY